MDLASLNIKVDSTQTVKAATDLTKLEKEAVKAENATRELGASYIDSNNKLERARIGQQKLTVQQQQVAISSEKARVAGERLAIQEQSVANALQRATLETKRLELAQNRLQEQQQKAELQQSKLNGVFQSATGYVRGLVAAYSFLELIKTADEYTLLKNRIDLSTKSTQESKVAFDRLASSAKSTGSSLSAAVEIFQRLSFVRSEIGASVDQMVQFTDTVQKLGVASGASGDALKFGLTQLGQSLSSNIVRAEEFNSIMENIPGVGKAIADQFGITTGQLRNLVINGEVLSKDVFTAILAASEQANKQFAAMERTSSRAAREAFVAFGLVADQLNNAWGISKKFAVVIDGIVDAVQRMAATLISVGQGISKITNGLKISELERDIKREDDRNNSPYQTAMGHTPVDTSSMKFQLAILKNENLAPVQSPGKIYEDMVKKSDGPAVKQTEAEIKVMADLRKEYEAKAKAADSKDKAAEKAAKAAETAAQKQAKLESDTIKDLEHKTQLLGMTNEEQAIANELFRAHVELSSTSGQKIADLTRNYERQKTSIENLKKVTDSLSDSFSEAFAAGISGAQSWGDVARKVITDIQNLLIQQAITNPIKNFLGGGSSGGGGLFGLIGTGLSAYFGGSAQASANTAAVRGAANPNLYGPGFASGGSFEVGGSGGTDSQLVAFRASPNETVSIRRPDQSGGEGGGGGPVFNIDARGADQAAVQRLEALVVTMNNQFKNRTLATVNEQFKRNPSFGKRS